jgi:hypothetical protein
MKIRLSRLELTCKQSVENVRLEPFTYFYGELGAGKSSIARLIDYCFAGGLVMTPALQSEFVAATLHFEVEGKPATLTRGRESDQVLATWTDANGPQQSMLPARAASGVVILDTNVENVSDFIFFLAGKRPPKVRRSQINEDSELERLSFRDLYWYCYLDQDTIDSSFFSLDPEAETFRRLKSRNVLRFILGVHQERVAELEAALEEVRRERLRLEGAANVLSQALDEADVSSDAEITSRVQELERQLARTVAAISEVRDRHVATRDHVTDRLRNQARQMAAELDSLERAESQASEALDNDRRHLNSIQSLSTKVRRIQGARAVLNGVEFERCPRCTQTLPARGDWDCKVCGQEENDTNTTEGDVAATEADIDGRVKELNEVIETQSAQLVYFRRRRRALVDEKQQLDTKLNAAMQQYDSAYLSEALEHERRRAQLDQEVRYLRKLQALPSKVASLLKAADALLVKEQIVRRELKEAREAAEQDMSNLTRLKQLFLDCLLRTKLPGFKADDIVHMKSPAFVPEVLGAETGELVTTSFGTLGSGGKKTLFKCCFAIAIHRLAAEIGATLPTLLIIDSPMKNISERENREQFVGFYDLLYTLASGELQNTQFIVIDKEYHAPPAELSVRPLVRHMRVESVEEPPLISYYRS